MVLKDNVSAINRLDIAV